VKVVVTGTDPRLGEGLRGRGGGDDDEVAVGKRIRVEPHRSVELEEVGVEFPNEQVPGILRAGEEDASRRARQLLHETFLRGTARDEVGLDPVSAQSFGRTGPDDRHPGKRALEPA